MSQQDISEDSVLRRVRLLIPEASIADFKDLNLDYLPERNKHVR